MRHFTLRFPFWAAPPAGARPVPPARRFRGRAGSAPLAVMGARASVAAPLLGLVLGALWPELGTALRPWLGVVVAALVFAAVASAEFGRASRQEAATAARLVLVSGLAAPVLVGLVARGAGWAPDLASGALLAAAGPVSLGASAVARRFGMPGRPVVWGAVAGLVLTPALVPLAAAVCGWHGPAASQLARSAAVVGLGPVLVALALRRAAPDAAATAAPLLRGTVVLALALLACSAGGRAAAALNGAGGLEAAGVAAATQGLGALAACGVGLLLAGRGAVRPLVLAAGLRNTSVVWAAATGTGALEPRTEAVLALFLAGNFLVTFGLMLSAGRLGATPPGPVPGQRTPALAAPAPAAPRTTAPSPDPAPGGLAPAPAGSGTNSGAPGAGKRAVAVRALGSPRAGGSAGRASGLPARKPRAPVRPARRAAGRARVVFSPGPPRRGRPPARPVTCRRR